MVFPVPGARNNLSMILSPWVSSYCLISRGRWVSVFYRIRILKQHPCMTPNLFLAQHYVFIDTGESSCRTIYLFLISLSLPPPPYRPICHKINHFLIQRNILIHSAAVAVCTTTFIYGDKHPSLCISQHGELRNYKRQIPLVLFILLH